MTERKQCAHEEGAPDLHIVFGGSQIDNVGEANPNRARRIAQAWGRK
jgi:hypothetical protein